MNTEPRATTSSPQRSLLVNEALEPFISNPEQFAALLRSDMARFAKLIKEASIKVKQ